MSGTILQENLHGTRSVGTDSTQMKRLPLQTGLHVLLGFALGLTVCGLAVWVARAWPGLQPSKTPVSVNISPGKPWAESWDSGIPIENYGLTNFGCTFTNPATGLYQEIPIAVYVRENGTNVGLVLADGTAVVIEHEKGLFKSAKWCRLKPSPFGE